LIADIIGETGGLATVGDVGVGEMASSIGVVDEFTMVGVTGVCEINVLFNDIVGLEVEF
jgi:hypothetical protein